VKCPEAELWIVKRSRPEAETLMRVMAKEELRRYRYNLLCLDPHVVDELITLIRERNSFHLFRVDFDGQQFQFEFNGLWFDTSFERQRF
jgi:hypothetical protein